MHPLEPSRRQRRRHDQAPPGVSVSVGGAASCTLTSRHLLVELLCADGVGFLFVRAPIPFIFLPERLLGGRRRVANRALLRELNECVYGLNFLGGFMSSGYLDVRGAASSGWAFAYQRILHALRLVNRPEAVEVGEELFGGSSLARSTIMWVSPRCRRPPRVHLHRSENRSSLCPRQLLTRRVWRTYAETELLLIWTKIASHLKVWPTSIMILS